MTLGSAPADGTSGMAAASGTIWCEKRAFGPLLLSATKRKKNFFNDSFTAHPQR